MAKAQINCAVLLLIVLTFGSGTDGVDSFGCSGKTSCQVVPSSCSDAVCSPAVTVVKTSDDQYTFNAQVTLGADKPNSYVAVGISKDAKMGGDAVVACTSEGVNLYENPGSPGSHEPSVVKNWKAGSPSSKSFAAANGKLTCSFTLPEVVEVSDSLTLKVSESYIFIATGSTSPGGLQHHTTVQQEKLNLKSSGSAKDPSNSNSGTATLPGVSVVSALLLFVLGGRFQ